MLEATELLVVAGVAAVIMAITLYIVIQTYQTRQITRAKMWSILGWVFAILLIIVAIFWNFLSPSAR